MTWDELRLIFEAIPDGALLLLVGCFAVAWLIVRDWRDTRD